MDLYKSQNMKLSTALEQAENKLNNFEAFIDVEQTAVSLQALEFENSKLQDTNIKIMEQLYEEKKNNRKMKVLKADLGERERELSVMERSNITLLERVEKLKRMVGKENGGLMQEAPEKRRNMFKKQWRKTASSGGNQFKGRDSEGSKNQGGFHYWHIHLYHRMCNDFLEH